MDLARIRIYRYALPLVRPLMAADRTMSERAGFLIRFESDDGHTGWGEAAPLPGFSRESIDDVQAELARLRTDLAGAGLPGDIEKLDGAFERWLTNIQLSPSARCGVEMAALNLLAESRATSVARLLSDRSLERVRLNGLITGENDVTRIVRQFKRDGYRAVKLKVGRQTLEEDIARTQDAAHELGGDSTLRLDANRSWSMDEAIRFAAAITDCTPAYIEEPLADIADLESFATETGLRVALDESLVDLEPEQLKQYAFVAAVVLKPTLLGGLERAIRFARAARELNIKFVLSSAFESSVGVAALTQLAAAYHSFNTPAGLDTLNFFSRDLLTEPIETRNGRMRTGQAARAAKTVDVTALEEIAP